MPITGPTNNYQLYVEAQVRARERGEEHLFAYPANFKKSGPTPDLNAPDVARLVHGAVERGLNLLHHPGMTIIVVTPQHVDQLYVTFNAPDPWHPHQWFHEASGQGWVIRHTDELEGLDALELVIARMDFRADNSLANPAWRSL